MLAKSRQPSFLAGHRLKLVCGVFELDTCATRSQASPASMPGKQGIESPYEVDPKSREERKSRSSNY